MRTLWTILALLGLALLCCSMPSGWYGGEEAPYLFKRDLYGEFSPNADLRARLMSLVSDNKLLSAQRLG
ncbi:unnamed protein product, partial [Mesorhabditis spiculigera]